MNPTVFAIAGGGWRTEFFLRVVRGLPERFRIGGMFVRDAGKGAAIEKQWGVKTYRTLDDMLKAAQPAFVVTSVPWPVNYDLLKELAAKKAAVLSETPPAPKVEDLTALNQLVKSGARIQVAEQYQFQPVHAARISLIQSGLIGEPSYALVSVAHGYHGVSLMRLFLGAGMREVRIRARNFDSPIVLGSGRQGPPTEEKIVNSATTIAWLDFGGKLGVYDFTGDQYFSWIRGQRICVRGEKGEIVNDRVRYLRDFRTPVEFDLRRQGAGIEGNLEGFHLKGVLAGNDWAYRNDYAPARLSDEEVAIAATFDKMGAYAAGGPDVYSLAEASQDHYLAMKIGEAAGSGQEVVAGKQPWAM